MRRNLIIIIVAFMFTVTCFVLGNSKHNNENIKITEDTQTHETKPSTVTPEPVKSNRENKLYYFIKNNTRTNVPIEYQDYLYTLLKEKGHEDRYELILTMIYHESRWNANLISKTDDYGLMQINKCNHGWLKETLGITNFLDPYQSIKAGVHMMCIYFDKYDNMEMALVCYNMGEGGALRKGITSSEYSRGVIEDMSLLTELED